MVLLLVLALLLVAPGSAWALTVPREVVPGQQVVIEGEDGLLGGVVTLDPGGPVGVVGTAFTWPEAHAGGRYLPGRRVGVTACSIPVTSAIPGLLASSQFCEGATVTIGAVPGVRLKRIARLAGARWTGWGGAAARGRTRRASAVAFRVVECDGELWYSAVDLRVRGRLQRLRGLAPC